MSKKILLQSLLKFERSNKRWNCKGSRYYYRLFNQTGKSVTDEERAIILNEFAKDAPQSNVMNGYNSWKVSDPGVENFIQM